MMNLIKENLLKILILVVLLGIYNRIGALNDNINNLTKVLNPIKYFEDYLHKIERNTENTWITIEDKL